MPDTPTLATPRLLVTMDDGSVHEVQAVNPDLLRYDRTASKHGWPKPQDAPFLWLTFLAWSALDRAGTLNGMSWSEFSETHAYEVRNLADANGVPVAAADPTPAGVEPE